ncbi:MAG TPA: N,N-dimethylformamidase beta subunit family domain-containing protein [Gaiellaceae bacterium]
MTRRILVLVLLGALVGGPTVHRQAIGDDEDGFAPTPVQAQEPDAIEASFARESYRPGAQATLRFFSGAAGVVVRLYRAGEETVPTVGYDELRGVPVSDELAVGNVGAGTVVPLRLGAWPSGLYFADLTAPGRVGYASFVLRPSRLGTQRVAIVMPTRTWQAYNFRDDDGDGHSDTWYAPGGGRHARLARPFLNRGVPPHFRQYDLPFLHWLYGTGKSVDFLAQADLDAATGAKLAAAYDLIVFPGHHEYVTAAEYDHVTRFRDLGGNLAFLSADNFFWRIDLRGNVMTRIAKWRNLGRPEAGLIGVQYNGNDRGGRRGAWLVRKGGAAAWLFHGVALQSGGAFSSGGVEIDSIATASPRGVEVVAAIPELFGPGRSADMTYYESAGGARVFAAGAFTLAGHAAEPAVRRLLENLWAHLANG